jgi:ankyrin repeat protein
MNLDCKIYLSAAWHGNIALMKHVFFKHSFNVSMDNLNYLAWTMAIESGAINTLLYLMQHKRNWISDYDDLIKYSIFLAVKHSRVDVISLLHHTGHNINHDISGIIAESANNMEMLSYLYQYGYIPSSADIYLKMIPKHWHILTEAIDQTGNNLFLMAALIGNEFILSRLIHNDTNLITSINYVGNNALHNFIIGSLNEDITIAIALIKKGINIYARNKDGNNAINMAAKYGKLRLLKYLFNNMTMHAVATSINNYGDNIFLTAARHGHCFILKYLVSIMLPDDVKMAVNFSFENAFILVQKKEVITANCRDILHLLHKTGNVIPRYRKSYSSQGSILLYSAMYNHLCIIKELHKMGFDMNYVNQSLDNALMIAACHGCLDIIKYLEDASVQYRKNLYGHDALMTACHSGHLPVVMYLHQRDIFKDMQSNTGMTAFLKAVEGNHIEVVKWLSDKTDIYARNNLNQNAMHIAIMQKSYSIIEYLCQRRFTYDFRELIMYATEYNCHHALFVLFRNKYRKSSLA